MVDGNSPLAKSLVWGIISRKQKSRALSGRDFFLHLLAYIAS
jgi:hypothetical protein